MFGLFRRKSVVDAVIDPDKGHLSKIGKFIGNQQFTDQEKAVMNAGLADAVREFSLATANQNTERSKARRKLAELWIKTQLGLILITVISLFQDDKELTKMLWEIATSDVMFYGTTGVMIFFFGAYGFGAHIKGKK